MTQPPADLPDWTQPVGRNQRQVPGSPFTLPSDGSNFLDVTLSATAHGLMVGVSPRGTAGITVTVQGDQSGVYYCSRVIDANLGIVICPVSPALDTSVTVTVINSGPSISAYVAEMDDVISTGEYATTQVEPFSSSTRWIVEEPQLAWALNPAVVNNAQLTATETVSGAILHVQGARFDLMNDSSTGAQRYVVQVYDGTSASGALLAQAQLSAPAGLGYADHAEFRDLDCPSGSIYLQSVGSVSNAYMSASAWGYVR